MGNAHHQEKLVQYVPLAAPEHREKGFVFKGCSIVVAAMKRWPKIVDGYPGTWEDYLREQYLREARLQDALVVNLGTGDPLTEAETRIADPYCLAILYEDGTFSKNWEEPRVDRSLAMRKYQKPDGKRKHSNLIQPSAENKIDEFRFQGTPCQKCGGVVRYIKHNACVPCGKAASSRYEQRK